TSDVFSSLYSFLALWTPLSFPTRRSFDLCPRPRPVATSSSSPAVLQSSVRASRLPLQTRSLRSCPPRRRSLLSVRMLSPFPLMRSEEHTSELQSRENLVCRLLLEKKNWRR